MKKQGKITKYNGLYGNIKDKDGKDYILLDKNLLDDSIDVNCDVEFESETHSTIEVDVTIARFVKKLQKKE